MTEADLTHAIVKALNQIPGVWVWRQNTGRRGGISFGKKGQGDITGVYRDGRRIELEVKLPGNKRFEPDQLAFVDRMSKFGAIAGVVRSVDDAIGIVSGSVLSEPSTSR